MDDFKIIPEDQNACQLIGCGDIGVDISRFDNLNPTQLLSLGSSLIFVVIIALGIGYTIWGALKIVRSEGDTTKVEEGAKIFKGVLIGIAMIFLGVIGLVLMLALFNAGDVVNVDPVLPPTA